MEDAHLTVEEQADYLWSEGWTIPDIKCHRPHLWARWVTRMYSRVTAGVDQWETVLRGLEYSDHSYIGFIRHKGRTQVRKWEERQLQAA